MAACSFFFAACCAIRSSYLREIIDIIHLDRDWKRPHNAGPMLVTYTIPYTIRKIPCTTCCQAISPDTQWSKRKTIISVSFTRVFCKSALVCPHIILPMHIYSLTANCLAKTSNVKWPKLGTRGTQLKAIQWRTKTTWGLLRLKLRQSILLNPTVHNFIVSSHL